MSRSPDKPTRRAPHARSPPVSTLESHVLNFGSHGAHCLRTPLVKMCRIETARNYLASDLRAALMPSLTPMSEGNTLSAALASRSL